MEIESSSNIVIPHRYHPSPLHRHPTIAVSISSSSSSSAWNRRRSPSLSFPLSASPFCFRLLAWSSSSPLILEKEGTISDKIIAAENLLNDLVETITEKKKSSFFEEENSSSVNSRFKRLFGREKPVHHILGGGKSADVLLWRNKKISASVLASATVMWVLFEWLDYHFLTLVCFALVLGMLAQFLWSNVSGLVSRERSNVPRVVIPEDLFVNIATAAGAEINRGLRFLQDVACGGNLKQFLIVVASLWAVAIIGNWCNFITVIYIGFVAAYTLPVLYEKYEDQVDSFVYQVLGQMQHNYKKLDAGVLSKIPKGRFIAKKFE